LFEQKNTKDGALDYTNEVNISISQAILNGASKEAIQKMIKSGVDINAIMNMAKEPLNTLLNIMITK